MPFIAHMHDIVPESITNTVCLLSLNQDHSRESKLVKLPVLVGVQASSHIISGGPTA